MGSAGSQGSAGSAAPTPDWLDDESIDVGEMAVPGIDGEGRFPGVTGSLRRHTARGTLINATFNISIAGLALLQRTLVAVFLTPSELGVWGLVLISLLTLAFIKESVIGDKFVQQSETDQERAFQRAFTLDLILTWILVLAAAAALPLFAAISGQAEIIVPGLVLLLAVLARSFQAPIWIFYRQMDFLRQRALLAVEPVVMFVVTIALAAAGASYWSLVIGAVIAGWAGALAAILASPYRFRFLLDRRTAREYFSFSWPLVAARFSKILVGAASLIVGANVVGVDGVGAIALAVSIIAFSDGVSAIVTQTIYPAICAVRDRVDLLAEAFVKSNRLALMWGLPFGFGVALFGSDLVHFVLGEKWVIAIVLLQGFGVMAALDQIGFNWSAFLRAKNHTRPLAVVGVVTVITFLAITVPLMIVDGLRGYAIGMLALTVVGVAARAHYLDRLFTGFRPLIHAARALLPSIPAVAGVLLVRAVAPGERDLALALGELALYIALAVAATWLFERTLIREAIGYLRRERASAGGPAAGTAGAGA